MTCQDDRRKYGALPPKKRKVPWLTIAPGEVRQGWVLSDSTFGFWLHWCDADPQLKRRSYLHRGFGKGCDHCARRSVARWQGALAFLPCNYRLPVLLGVTLSMLETCPELDQSSGVPLRGVVLHIERPGCMPYGALKATRAGTAVALERLPEAFDVLEALALRYGVDLPEIYDAMCWDQDPDVVPLPADR